MLWNNAELHNVAELEPAGEGGSRILRLPASLRATLNENARNFAVHSSGVEVRFNLAPGATARLTLAEGNGLTAEVYQGCFRVKAPGLTRAPKTIEITQSPKQALLNALSGKHNLPFDSQLTRVLLPATAPVRLISLEGDITPPRPEQLPRQRYLAYGSSITHGDSACRPSGIYTMLTARHLGADLVNHGYGGGAHLEETMARYLAGLTWDFATLEMGINIGDWPIEKFAAGVERFVDIISSAHPDKWIFCIDVYPFYEDLKREPGVHCRGFRPVVRDIVKKLNRPRVVHVDATTILTDITGLSHDLVHPTDDGFAEMATNLAAAIGRTMKPA